MLQANELSIFVRQFFAEVNHFPKMRGSWKGVVLIAVLHSEMEQPRAVCVKVGKVGVQDVLSSKEVPMRFKTFVSALLRTGVQ